jgi:hypothetical protein
MARSPHPAPPHRYLRVYTYDPSIKTRLETALINETTLKIPWEENLGIGPSGEYLEVIDYDPASEDCFYEPVDLNDPHILATNGLAPSEGNPQFHQQMVYAVGMATIANFEKALGRKALWGRRVWDPSRGKNRPVLKLRIYPHALREANAYYSPEKKALLFGYFPAALSEADEPSENLPGGLVFTCLSHDVVAHEMTHALLDGLHRYYALDTGPDSLAFHEAFADIVALFQHFSEPEALRHEIGKTSGDLRSDNRLAQLAVQFGQAIGNHGALRNAIGKTPTQSDYESATEAHGRGSVLVAAMFDAFLAIYELRTADLVRIATGGTGRLPGGRIHPDLVNRLAREASKAASHLLRMAIRALDYSPPVDLNFGDYLRALITGDIDLMPDDPLNYRVAVIEGFRRRGIYPTDVRTLADDALRWRNPLRDIGQEDFRGLLGEFAMLSRKSKTAAIEVDAYRCSNDRARIADSSEDLQKIAWGWLKKRYGFMDRPDPSSKATGWSVERSPLAALGLALHTDAPRSIPRSAYDGKPSMNVHSVRYALRPRQDGATIRDVVLEVVLRRWGYYDPKIQEKVDHLKQNLPRDLKGVPPEYRPDFEFRGGCTLLIDGETGEVRYVISKDILSEGRLERRRKYETGDATSAFGMTYHAVLERNTREPFAMLHRGF